MLRKCRVCGIEAHHKNELDKFASQPNSKYGKANICIPCKSKYRQEWRLKKGKKYQRERSRKDKQKLKRVVMSLYGNKCACCWEKELVFLTMDHINNDGKAERKKFKGSSYAMYAHMRDLFYKDKEQAQSRYQILCWNCNMGKQHSDGTCPHKSIKDTGVF